MQALRNEDLDISVIDFDRVEMKNVASQFHFKGSVGKKKAAAIRQTMLFCYGRKLRDVNNRLTADNTGQLLGGADLLVDCLDNAEGRNLVQVFARTQGIPCVHGALAADGGFSQVIWTESFKADAATAGAATCEDGEFLPFIQATAAYLALAVQAFLRQDRKVGYSISPAGVQKI